MTMITMNAMVKCRCIKQEKLMDFDLIKITVILSGIFKRSIIIIIYLFISPYK